MEEVNIDLPIVSVKKYKDDNKFLFYSNLKVEAEILKPGLVIDDPSLLESFDNKGTLLSIFKFIVQ